MKKALVWSAAILFCLLIAAYGYLQYRDYRSYRYGIHKNAALIFKINVDGLIRSGAVNLASKKNIPKGFTLPANVFLYTVSSRSAQTFFLALPVTDTAKLRQYLKTVLAVQNLKKNDKGRLSGSTLDERLKVMYDTKNLAICYTLKKENVSDILTDLLDRKNLLKDNDQVMGKLKQADAQIAYTFKNYSGTGTFKDNTLFIRGSFPVQDLGVPDQSYAPMSIRKDAAIRLWLNADLKKLPAGDTLRFKNHFLEQDTLLKYYGGITAFELGNNIKQTNKIITYTYNDDFEKTAEVKIKEVQVPELTLSFSGKSGRLVKYLQQQMVIGQENQLNKELFPLYQIYSRGNVKELQLSTNKTALLSPGVVKTPYFFFLEADFNQMKRQNQFPFLNSYFRHFSYLKAKAVKENAEKAHLEIEFRFNAEE